MGVTAFLNNARLGVEPGGEASCEVQVRNSGAVVDQFTVDVVGFAREWVAIEPPTMNLFPGAEATARVVFKPPRSPEVHAGPVPFGIRVLSREDPRGSVVEEGVIEIAPFTDMSVELVPAKSRGRRTGRHDMAIDNNGNRPIDAEVLAVDPENELNIQVEPPTFRAEPGTTVLVKTKVKPKKRFLRGAPVTHPFQLVVVPDGGEAATADGRMVQEQLLPKWLLPALAALLAVIIALVVLWFTLFKPAINSAAKEQAKVEASAVASQASQASQAAADAGKKADAAATQASQASEAAGGAGSGSNKPGGAGSSASPLDPSLVGSATNFRIGAKANKTADKTAFSTFSFTAPGNQSLNITDFYLQNPAGDAGIVRILIDGQVAYEADLANFRDLDEHYRVPLHVNPNKPVVFAVNCVAPGGTNTQCTPGVSFSGRLVK